MAELKLHSWLKGNLDIMKEAVLYDDWDGVIIVDGMEGSGKSTLAQQAGKYLDLSLDLSRIVFTPDQFIKAIEASEKGQCIIWDETDFQSGNVAKRHQRVLRRYLQVVRERNLFLILVAPYFFDLDKYVAVARSRFLLHVFTHGFKRGQFEFYSYNRKRKLYFLGKQRYWDYNVVDQDWRNPAWFRKGLVVDKKAYTAKKRAATKDVASGSTDPFWDRDQWVVRVKEQLGLKNEDIGKGFGMSGERVRQILKVRAEEANKRS